MPRAPRIQLPGAVYHVTAIENFGRTLFAEANDRTFFRAWLGRTVERYGWICESYCVMTTHYHLLIKTPDANLADGMRYLNGVYGQFANGRRGEYGHVFRGRYDAKLVESDA